MFQGFSGFKFSGFQAFLSGWFSVSRWFVRLFVTIRFDSVFSLSVFSFWLCLFCFLIPICFKVAFVWRAFRASPGFVGGFSRFHLWFVASGVFGMLSRSIHVSFLFFVCLLRFLALPQAFRFVFKRLRFVSRFRFRFKKKKITFLTHINQTTSHDSCHLDGIWSEGH